MGSVFVNQAKLQEDYRRGTVNLSSLSNRESTALFTPNLRTGTILIDQHNRRYRVDKVMCHTAVLVDDPPLPPHLRFIKAHHKFRYEPKTQRLEYESSSIQLDPKGRDKYLSKHAKQRGLLSNEELDTFSKYVTVCGDNTVSYCYRLLSQENAMRIAKGMEATWEFMAKTSAQLKVATSKAAQKHVGAKIVLTGTPPSVQNSAHSSLTGQESPDARTGTADDDDGTGPSKAGTAGSEL